jgi:hypothetical protein
MTKKLIKFMEEALGNQPLLDDFEIEFNKLYDAQGNPIANDADKKLSYWFEQKGYKIPAAQCEKLRAPMTKAKGRVMPQY